MWDDVSDLTLLGKSKTEYVDRVSPDILESFPNQFPDRDYTVVMSSEEFTSLCPMTGQPDYGCISVEYVPDKLCIESKSFKLYLFSYRQEPTFMETVTNRILDDLAAACKPRYMAVTAEFNARGGVAINVRAEYAGK
ncbi:MAG: preQ(1) synthase [Desulfonatronovibrionaceae bacterium]